mgnify:CR=1 FL=1
MKIAMAQVSPETGDLKGNAGKIRDAVRRARERGCDLVVTPEAALTGSMSGDLLEVGSFVDANLELLHDVIVPECRDVAAVVGFVDRADPSLSGEGLHNAAAVVQDGQIRAVAHKRNLCQERYRDETRYFAPGRRTTFVDLDLDGGSIRTALLIGEDLRGRNSRESGPLRDVEEAGPDLVVSIHATAYDTETWAERLAFLRDRGERSSFPLVYVSAVGIGDNLKDIILFDGRSALVEGEGEVVALGPLFGDEVVVGELGEDRRGRPLEVPRWKEEEELHAALTHALREYSRQVGFSRVLVGVSGGVDSSLCAALAADAMGPENVLALFLPSRHTQSESRDLAVSLCRNLGVELLEMPIEPIHQAARKVLRRHATLDREVSDENLQARTRGMLLMGVSNETGRLVLATGNKTELGLGYCTLYGDMVGGLLLLGDVNKRQVYRLAEHLNRRAEGPLIPEATLRRKPTPELAPEQEDPFDYPVVAPLVDDLVARAAPRDILERFERRELGAGYPGDVYERHDLDSFGTLVRDTYDRYQDAAFKRAQGSPTVVVSPRALGFDLRETIISHWRPDW